MHTFHEEHTYIITVYVLHTTMAIWTELTCLCDIAVTGNPACVVAGILKARSEALLFWEPLEGPITWWHINANHELSFNWFLDSMGYRDSHNVKQSFQSCK